MKNVRVAIFVDYRNTICDITEKVINEDKDIDLEPFKELEGLLHTVKVKRRRMAFLNKHVWENFNCEVLDELKEKSSGCEYTHVGTFLTLGIKRVKSKNNPRKVIYDKIQEISEMDGFIASFEISNENGVCFVHLRCLLTPEREEFPAAFFTAFPYFFLKNRNGFCRPQAKEDFLR